MANLRWKEILELEAAVGKCEFVIKNYSKNHSIIFIRNIAAATVTAVATLINKLFFELKNWFHPNIATAAAYCYF